MGFVPVGLDSQADYETAFMGKPWIDYGVNARKKSAHAGFSLRIFPHKFRLNSVFYLTREAVSVGSEGYSILRCSLRALLKMVQEVKQFSQS